MSDEKAALNTDREIWRGKSRAEFGDDDCFYADSLFIRDGEVEALGICCDGFVIVKSVRDWHKLAKEEFKAREAKKPKFNLDDAGAFG